MSTATKAELVRILLMGDRAAVEVVAQALRFAQQSGRFQVAEESEFYANRRGPGTRLYLTALVGEEASRGD